MKVSLTELLEGQKKVLNLEIKDNIQTLGYLGDEILLTAPATFKGSIYNSKGEFYIEGSVEGVAEFNCYRCLKKFQQRIHGKVYERIIEENSSYDEELDYFFIINNQLDISEIMENALILSLPTKIICDEHCKGLCAVCGMDLNEQLCNCEEDYIDPRLAKLKDLLQQD